LLGTYHDERREISQRITQQSLQNSINVVRIANAAAGAGDSGMSTEEVLVASRRYGNHLGVEFGAAYASSAVIADGSAPPQVADSYSDYVQSATPGCRAPHVWLGREEERLSTLDLFGPAFTLLAAPQATAWCEAAVKASRDLGVRIDTYRVGAAGLSDTGAFARSYGIEADGAVLVRPDGHVAWRSRTAPSSGSGGFGDAVRRILART